MTLFKAFYNPQKNYYDFLVNNNKLHDSGMWKYVIIVITHRILSSMNAQMRNFISKMQQVGKFTANFAFVETVQHAACAAFPKCTISVCHVL